MRDGSKIVTAIMSAFDEEDYLARAIKSILEQTHTDFEFLITNDGSTDETSKILQHLAENK